MPPVHITNKSTRKAHTLAPNQKLRRTPAHSQSHTAREGDKRGYVGLLLFLRAEWTQSKVERRGTFLSTFQNSSQSAKEKITVINEREKKEGPRWGPPHSFLSYGLHHFVHSHWDFPSSLRVLLSKFLRGSFMIEA